MGERIERVVVRELVKLFGPTRALAGIDAELRAGEVTVIEGPNGSGKSTLLAVVARLARPTSGTVDYGSDRQDEPGLRAQIGVLSHAAMLYPDLSGVENLALFARLYAIETPRERIDDLVDRFAIGSYRARPCRTYSRGQLQRVALARALLHRPSLLLLDEPATGLDARGVADLEAALEAERAAGTVTALVTHDAELRDRVGDVCVRLHRGRVQEVSACPC
ncbi:MAG: ABC transporter ATP-binding protein [Myxococcales bacterium]|nr:ABC transporter ATP-binding protein [Myxococcales bacterium]